MLNPHRLWWLVLGATVLVGAFSLLVGSRWRAATKSLTADIALQAPLPAVKPPPPADDYVGSAACAKCHAEIYETYTKHPMHLSAGWVLGEHDVEAYDEPAEFQPHRNRRYRVERTDDGVLHHEFIFDTQGDLIDDVAHPVRLFIGSGTRGRAYGIIRGDRLYQSPISWFSADGGRWDLSPGFQSGRRSSFERLIVDECMMCHAGRMAAVPNAQDTFREPWMLETGIGCERCHGPGRRHVAWHEAGAAHEDGTVDDDGTVNPYGLQSADHGAIVNPARLDPARRESICNQCHLIGKLNLPRYGRSIYDFRPGQLLDDVSTVLVEGTGVRDDGTTKAVSQVQQMRASACFQDSEGRLGCTSCHAPHFEPAAPAAAEFYRGRCLQCHAQRGCSLPEAERAAPPAENSCIHCHMPRLAASDIAHASQTDHRVRRTPDTHIASGPLGPTGEWELFDHAEQRLQRWELDRVRGIAIVALTPESSLRSTAKGREAETLLRSSILAAPDDVPALRAMGYLAAIDGRLAEGREYLERLLALAPRDGTTLQLLVNVCHRLDDLEATIRYGELLMQVNPWHAGDHQRLSDAFYKTGRLNDAIRESEEALKLDPTLTAARGRLVEAYRQAGNDDASLRHADVLRRIGESY